jgi:hypothetical protein
MWYMTKKSIDVTVESAAPPAAVYALLRAGETWPTWSPITSFELERPADHEPEGVGAVRIFRTVQPLRNVTTSRERIVELVPDRRLSYVLLSGLPLSDYRADVDLTPNGSGTTIRWHSTFDPAVRGTGWFYRAVLGAFIRRCAQGLAAHASTVQDRSTRP